MGSVVSLLLPGIAGWKVVLRGGWRKHSAPIAIYAGSTALLGVLSLSALSLTMRSVVDVLPGNEIGAAMNRVEKVAYKNTTSSRRVGELKAADRLETPVSFQSREQYARRFEVPAALLPDPHPAEMARRLTVFLGGDSEQPGQVTGSNPPPAEVISVTSTPAVAGYLAECKDGCLTSASLDDPNAAGDNQSAPARLSSDFAVPDAAEAELLADLKPGTVDDVYESGASPHAIAVNAVATAPAADPPRVRKPGKRGGKGFARFGGTLDRSKKSIVSTAFSTFIVDQSPKKSRMRLAQVDLFTKYLIGTR